RRLVADGDTVIAANGPGASSGPSGKNITRLPLDVSNDVSVRACVQMPVDAVVHLAAVALSKAAERDPARAWAVNAEGTARLAAALAKASAEWTTQPLF